MALAGRAAAPGGAQRSGVAAGRLSGGWLEGDLVAEGFEFGDQATGFPVGVEAAGEEVGAELVVGHAAGQDVPMMTSMAWATTMIAFFLAVGLR